jgi:hypothetical protein
MNLATAPVAAPIVTVEQARAIPVSAPEMAKEKDGYVKVRLDFLTNTPHHIHSQLLAEHYDLQGPYLENISVLVSQGECFDLLECYAPLVTDLVKMKAIGDCQLVGFEIQVEDDTTLAYVFN